MMRLSMFLLTFSAPGLAAAQCPSAADLHTGIALATSQGEVETFTRVDTHRVQSLYMYSDTAGSRVTLGKGVYVLEVLEVEYGIPVIGTRRTLTFPLLAEDMPQVAPWGGWSAKVDILDSDGPGSENHHYTFGAPTSQTIGACTYEMIPIELRYPSDKDVPDVDYLHYLPELGISYLARSDYDGQSEIYSYQTIRVAR